MSNFFLVAFGGSIGASTRYLFYLISKNLLSTSNLFINTLIVNIIGSFLIGYLIVLIENKSLSQDFIKYFFIIGILGSFTTFSAFSLESFLMFEKGDYHSAIIFILMSVILSILGLVSGIYFFRVFF